VLLAQTPSAIARIDLGVLPEAPGGAKGRRGEASASASSAEGKKGRRRGAGGSEAPPGKKGGDVKVAKLEDPCLFLGYFAPGRAVMVERPWKDVLKNIPEPMYRHRFGT
jgi:U3 small nucleolar RNA-associated protein 4